MYNGQNSQFGSNNQPFFTAGVGNDSPYQNNFEPENDLDLTHQPSWLNGHNLHNPRNSHFRLNSRNIGNRAFFSSESPNLDVEQIATSAPNQMMGSEPSIENAGLGEVVDLSLPPTTASTTIPTQSEQARLYDPSSIRTDGDRLHYTTLSEVNRVIEHFEQTGNAADFYTAIRGDENTPGMMRENLKNSYHREVA